MNYFANLFRSRKGQIVVSVSLILIALVIFFARQHQRNKQLKVDAAFGKYIESYTTGVISKQSTIRIKLAGEVQVSHAQNEQLKDGIFDFSPSIKGKAYWIDDRTIEFRPAEVLDIDKKYTADFNLGKIIKVESDYEHFKFGFQTIKPDFSITFAGLQSESATSGQNMKLIGNIQTADGEEQAAIEKLLDVQYASPVKVSWQHNTVAKSHQFTITKITRTNTANALTVNWDGDKLDIDKKGNQEFRVPALGEFKVLDIKAVQDNDQYVSVQFSDPIMVGQNLSGLIGINNSSDLAYTIDGSIVKVYA